jgi:hypothetical protein
MFTGLTTFPIYLKRSNVTKTLEIFNDAASTTDLFAVE